MVFIFKRLHVMIQSNCYLFSNNLTPRWSLIFKRVCTLIQCDSCFIFNNFVLWLLIFKWFHTIIRYSDCLFSNDLELWWSFVFSNDCITSTQCSDHLFSNDLKLWWLFCFSNDCILL